MRDTLSILRGEGQPSKCELAYAISKGLYFYVDGFGHVELEDNLPDYAEIWHMLEEGDLEDRHFRITVERGGNVHSTFTTGWDLQDFRAGSPPQELAIIESLLGHRLSDLLRDPYSRALISISENDVAEYLWQYSVPSALNVFSGSVSAEDTTQDAVLLAMVFGTEFWIKNGHGRYVQDDDRIWDSVEAIADGKLDTLSAKFHWDGIDLSISLKDARSGKFPFSDIQWDLAS